MGLKPDTRGQKQVLSPNIADEMTVLMKGTVADGEDGRPKGTAYNVNIQNAVGKTGTSDKRKDLWFIGYIPKNLVTGIWLGNPAFDRQETQIYSSDTAQIWQDYMQSIGYANKVR